MLYAKVKELLLKQRFLTFLIHQLLVAEEPVPTRSVTILAAIPLHGVHVKDGPQLI